MFEMSSSFKINLSSQNGKYPFFLPTTRYEVIGKLRFSFLSIFLLLKPKFGDVFAKFKISRNFFSSIKPNHKSFEEKRYWRGPVWINCNWFIYKGLKNKDKFFSDKIKNKTIKILEKKGFFEYYSCKNGKPMGARNFSWSAALYLDLKLNN